MFSLVEYAYVWTNLVKRVVTLCSLWSNAPMFEQEAPKWHAYQSCSSGTYVWVVLCIQLSLVPVIFLRAWTCEKLILFEPEILKPDLRASKLCRRQISLEPDCKPDIWELQWDWLPLSRILNQNSFWWPGTSLLSRDFVTVIYFLSRKFSDGL